MLKAIRNFGSTLMLFMVSIVLVGFVADEVADSHLLAKNAAIPVCMDLMADNVDLDEDEDDENEFIANLFFGDRTCASHCLLETGCTKTDPSRRPQSLLRGQVRRYSPRKSLADSHNHTLSSNLHVAWIYSMPLFLYIRNRL